MQIEITLTPAETVVVMGIFLGESSIDVTSSDVTHKITSDMIERLPH